MNKLIYFLPETDKTKNNTSEEFEIEGKYLKIIYYKEHSSRFKFFCFKRKIKKEMINAVAFENSFSKKIAVNTIYKSGVTLTLHHLNNILKKMKPEEPICFYTTNINHLEDIRDVIMNYKRIIIVTDEKNYDDFNFYLSEKFGILGAVYKNSSICFPTTVIMPQCSIIPTVQSHLVVNLNPEFTFENEIVPCGIKYNPPPQLKNISDILKNADALECAMDFFDISYNKATVSSVIFNKGVKKENE